MRLEMQRRASLNNPLTAARCSRASSCGRSTSPKRRRSSSMMRRARCTSTGGRLRAWQFIPQLGKVMPIQIDAVAGTETKSIVHYETVEERRAAMLAKGWSPAALAALEEAMEPNFLRDMREENERQGEAPRRTSGLTLPRSPLSSAAPETARGGTGTSNRPLGALFSRS